LILGGIFIFTGFAKIHGIPALIAEINQYKMPAGACFALRECAPYIEIAVGIVLFWVSRCGFPPVSPV